MIRLLKRAIDNSRLSTIILLTQSESELANAIVGLLAHGNDVDKNQNFGPKSYRTVRVPIQLLSHE